MVLVMKVANKSPIRRKRLLMKVLAVDCFLLERARWSIAAERPG